MERIRIWFNHWFSTVYHIINLIKEDPYHTYTVIGTNEHENFIYAEACDESYREPTGLSDEEYVRYCLDFCREHRVDVFAPKRRLEVISAAYARFREAGVKLLVDEDSAMLEILKDKIATYRFLSEREIPCLPTWREARSYDDFLRGYEELSSVADRVCYKAAADEGAMTFRVIDDRIETLAALYEKPGNKITLEAAKKIMSRYDFRNPILMMPFLGGVEISADCVATARGNLILPRYKTTKRYSEIKFDEEVMAVCDRIMKVLNLKMPINIQFKSEKGRPYLLEINPRMSGGVPLSCKATGINLPMIAVNGLLGNAVEWSYPEQELMKVAHLETPTCF